MGIINHHKLRFVTSGSFDFIELERLKEKAKIQVAKAQQILLEQIEQEKEIKKRRNSSSSCGDCVYNYDCKYFNYGVGCCSYYRDSKQYTLASDYNVI